MRPAAGSDGFSADALAKKTGAAPADEAYIIDNEVLNNALRNADTHVSDMIAGPGANLTSEVRNGGNVEYYSEGP
jgi:hypothetical protein